MRISARSLSATTKVVGDHEQTSRLCQRPLLLGSLLEALRNRVMVFHIAYLGREVTKTAPHARQLLGLILALEAMLLFELFS